LQQVEQSSRAEQAEEKRGTTGAILNGCAMLVQLASEVSVRAENTAIEIGRAECRKG